MNTPNTQSLDALQELRENCGTTVYINDVDALALDAAIAALAPSRADTAGDLPVRDASKPATEQGLFRKFDVRRADGSDAPGGKHHGCDYFVLDVTHDLHARVALAAYASAVEATHPQLATDMRVRYEVPAPAGDAQGAVDGVLVPRAVIDAFPEINPSNYGDDEVSALNQWGIEVVTAAAPTPETPDVEANHVERLLALRNEGGELFIMPEDAEALDVAIHALSAPACPVAAGASDFLFALRRSEATKQTAPAVDWVHAEEDAYVIQRLGRLLAEISITLNGPYLANSVWSYHDLPAKVEALASESRTVADEMDAWSEKRLSGPHDNRNVRRLLGGWADRLRVAAQTPEQPETSTPEAPSGSQAGDVVAQLRALGYNPLWNAICHATRQEAGGIGVSVRRFLEEMERQLGTTPTPADSGVRDALEQAARKLYVASTDSDTIHCNRFPAWSELSETVRENWRIKAAKPESA